MKWLLFLLLPVVKCVIMLGEKRWWPSRCFKKKSRETRGENPCDERWKFTVCHFIQVLLKLVLSLYMSLRFWYKSRSLRSPECE